MKTNYLCESASQKMAHNHSFARGEHVPVPRPPPLEIRAPDPARTASKASGGTSLLVPGDDDASGGDDDGVKDTVFSTTSQTPSKATPFQGSVPLSPPPPPPPPPLLLAQWTDRLSGVTVRTAPEKGRRFSSQGWSEQSTVQGKHPDTRAARRYIRYVL